jgi:hypothetical protein
MKGRSTVKDKLSRRSLFAAAAVAPLAATSELRNKQLLDEHFPLRESAIDLDEREQADEAPELEEETPLEYIKSRWDSHRSGFVFPFPGTATDLVSSSRGEPTSISRLGAGRFGV